MPLVFDVQTLVYKKLPFLAESNDTNDLILLIKTEAIYLVQPYLEKESPEDESLYSKAEISLLADLTAYQILSTKVLENSGGSTGQEPSSNKAVKNAKADVVEVTFEYLKPGMNLTEETTKILETLKMSLCQKAAQLNVYLPMCELPDSTGGIFTVIEFK